MIFHKFTNTLGILVLIFLTAQLAFGATTQIETNKKIVEMHVYADYASVIYTPAHTDGAGCTGIGASNTVTISWSADENYRAMYSAALSAYVTGKTVGFGVNGCITGYGGEVPKMYRLDVQN